MNLDTYFPEVRHPVIGGKHIAIAPLKVRQIPPFMRAIGPAAGLLFSGDLAGALGAHGEELIHAVAVATDQPADWLGDLDADEFLRLVGDVVEVNADFFAHRVTPALEATVGKLMSALTHGATPSQPSSQAASAGETATT